MNSKMTTNSHLSTTEPKNQKQKQTKQTTRRGTQAQKWRSHGRLSVRKEKGKEGDENVQGIRSTNGSYKIGGG